MIYLGTLLIGLSRLGRIGAIPEQKKPNNNKKKTTHTLTKLLNREKQKEAVFSNTATTGTSSAKGTMCKITLLASSKLKKVSVPLVCVCFGGYSLTLAGLQLVRNCYNLQKKIADVIFVKINK